LEYNYTTPNQLYNFIRQNHSNIKFDSKVGNAFGFRINRDYSDSEDNLKMVRDRYPDVDMDEFFGNHVVVSETANEILSEVYRDEETSATSSSIMSTEDFSDILDANFIEDRQKPYTIGRIRKFLYECGYSV